MYPQIANENIFKSFQATANVVKSSYFLPPEKTLLRPLIINISIIRI